jgi:hypothetical protein
MHNLSRLGICEVRRENIMGYLAVLIIIALLVLVPMYMSSKRNESASRAKLNAQYIEHGVINNEPSLGVVWIWTIVGIAAAIAFVIYGLPH